MTDLLHVRQATKHYGAVQALRGVDLDVQEGEVVGFVGPNGAGKTTLLRICVGIVQRTSGDIDVLGYDPAHASIEIRKRCSYLPGEQSLYRGLTGEQFLEFACHGYSRRQSVVEITPELFDLPLERKIREYSAGMKQRLALRAALTVDTPLFLLDEPDRAIDATARMQLREVLLALRAEGRGVLLSSHHLAEVEAIADRIVFILDGQRVPDEEIRRAREQLRSQIRLRLEREVELPPGYRSVETQPGGTLLVTTETDPATWLAQIPADAVLASEIGATRLEDLYRTLTQARQAVR